MNKYKQFITMKKIITLLTAAIFVVACSKPAGDDEAAKRKQLQEYKQQVHDLQEKITALETDLEGNEKDEVVNVKVVELKPQLFEHFIEVTGKVESEYNINVSPETSGIINEIFVTEGQDVSKDFVMAKLNTNILERTLEELEVQLDLASTTFKRQKNLWDQHIGSEMQYLQAKNSQESLEKRIESVKTQIALAEVKAPIDGVVDVVYQEKGDIGGPQTPFAKVVNISKIKIYADVSESYITAIKKGAKVNVFFPALNRELQTTIQRIGNTIDPNNRTFRVRLDINNANKTIKPNLVSIVRFRDYVAENAIVVPSLYIKQDFKGDYAYISDESNGKTVAKKVYVTTGVTNNNMTEVTDGLDAGMKIISEGYSQVASGTVINY